MGKEFNALERLVQDVFNSCDSDEVLNDYNTIKQALTTKSKKEQAFDIINKKEINITLVKLYETREEYVNSICRDYVVIRDNLPTEQEFNLLKEVLKND